MSIESLWNISNREERAAMLAGMGVESSRCLQAWSDCEWDNLPDVVRYSMTADYRDRDKPAVVNGAEYILQPDLGHGPRGVFRREYVIDPDALKVRK